MVGVAVDGAETCELVRRRRPDLLLLDLVSPRMNGLVTLQKVAQLELPTRVIAFADATEPELMIEALWLGARAVLSKHAQTHELFDCLHAVGSGLYWTGVRGVEKLGQAELLIQKTGHRKKAVRHGLTPRELEVMRAVAAGHGNRGIARALAISEDTVKHHLTRIFEKLAVKTRLELAVKARKLGMNS